MSDRDFSNALSDRGYTRYRTKSERGWDGITLPAAESDTVDDTLDDPKLVEAFD